MSDNKKNNTFFSDFNPFFENVGNFYALDNLNNFMSYSMKMMEDASDISKNLFFKNFDAFNFFSLFENSFQKLPSAYIDYLETMGFVSKDTYDQLIEKYDKIQKELSKSKTSLTQKNKKISEQEKKLKAFKEDIVKFDAKVKDLENELAAEKINSVTSTTGDKKKKKTKSK
ncbi:MAG: hypothetical protein CSA18_04420 [Deltaproteobacteria bacterium]|nr:MAG: hypothetical protein CSA18_04420 [Deltaproteobacteria bacterium]